MYTLPHKTTPAPAKIAVHYRRPQFSYDSIHDHRLKLYKAAAKHYANALSLGGDCSIVVCFTTTKLSHDYLGLCESRRDSKGRWVVKLHRDGKIWANLKTLAHELVHVRQFARGDLALDDRGEKLLWHGEAGHGSKAWEDRPWEKEANALEKILRKDFAHCLKGAFWKLTAKHY